jgi:hypothetical protein
MVEPEETSVAREWLCKHVLMATKLCDHHNRYVCSNRGTVGGGVFYHACAKVILGGRELYPCGGRVKYVHHDPVSCRRRRKGKSQIWDIKIYLQVWRDSDLRKTVLARASSIYKRQTHPLVREGDPQNQDHNYQTNKYVVMSPRWSSTPRLTDWLTDRQSQYDFDFELVSYHVGLDVKGLPVNEDRSRWTQKLRNLHCWLVQVLLCSKTDEIKYNTIQSITRQHMVNT